MQKATQWQMQLDEHLNLILGDSNNNLISFDIVNTILTNNSILSSPLSSDLIINDFQQKESLGYSLCGLNHKGFTFIVLLRHGLLFETQHTKNSTHMVYTIMY